MPQTSVQVTVEGTARVTVKILVLDDAAKGTLETSMREKFGTPTTANEFLIQQNVIGVTVVDNPRSPARAAATAAPAASSPASSSPSSSSSPSPSACTAFARTRRRRRRRQGAARPADARRRPPAWLEPGRRPGERAHLLRQREHRRNFGETPGGGGAPAPPSLPAGWQSAVDPSSGKTYYVNSMTGQTSWEMPR